jgi:uncharacterized protein (DUF2267 family)
VAFPQAHAYFSVTRRREFCGTQGVRSLDHSIDKTNAWLAEIAAEFGTGDRQFAWRVTRAWLHALRDRLPVPVAANLAAQLPEVLRGVFYGGWSPSRVPVRYGPRQYVQRFARDAGIRDADVPRAARLVTRAVRRHVSGGALDEALDVLPPGLSQLIEPASAAEPAADRRGRA